MGDESARDGDSELSMPAHGEGDEELVRRTDEYHRREAEQQLAKKAAHAGNGERYIALI